MDGWSNSLGEVHCSACVTEKPHRRASGISHIAQRQDAAHEPSALRLDRYDWGGSIAGKQRNQGCMEQLRELDGRTDGAWQSGGPQSKITVITWVRAA